MHADCAPCHAYPHGLLNRKHTSPLDTDPRCIHDERLVSLWYYIMLARLSRRRTILVSACKNRVFQTTYGSDGNQLRHPIRKTRPCRTGGKSVTWKTGFQRGSSGLPGWYCLEATACVVGVKNHCGFFPNCLAALQREAVFCLYRFINKEEPRRK